MEVMEPPSIGNGPDRRFKSKTDEFLVDGLLKKTVRCELAIRAAIAGTDEANPFGVLLW